MTARYEVCLDLGARVQGMRASRVLVVVIIITIIIIIIIIMLITIPLFPPNIILSIGLPKVPPCREAAQRQISCRCTVHEDPKSV